MDPNPMNNPMPANPSASKQWLLWGGIALVIVIVAAIAWWFPANPTGGETRQEIAPGQVLFTAQEGQIVSDFPRELITEDSPLVTQSQRIEYTTNGVNQPSVRYQSAWNMEENVAAFRDVLRAGAWAVSRAGDEDERPETFFQAARDDETVTITLAAGTDGIVTVSIAYTKG